MASETIARARRWEIPRQVLRGVLWIRGLVGRRVGHGERKAVDELGVTPLPEPSRLGLLLDLRPDLDGRARSVGSDNLARGRQ